MVKGESGEQIRYYPEKVNRPNGEALTGKIPAKDHMRNWIDCVRSRKKPECISGYRLPVSNRGAHGQPRLLPGAARHSGVGKVDNSPILKVLLVNPLCLSCARNESFNYRADAMGN
jgi:hypothetical protein